MSNENSLDTCIEDLKNDNVLFKEQIKIAVSVGKLLNRLFWFTIPFVIMLFIAIVKMSYDNKTSMEVIKVDMSNHIKNNERDFVYIKERLDHNARDCIVKYRTKVDNNG